MAGVVILLAGAIFILPVHHYIALKEKAKKCQKENIQDFPMIVHLMTLYMGAGLSFSSTVRRISTDYRNNNIGTGKRHAFDQILWIDQQMNMGMSQKEACMELGRRFDENVYQRLSITLLQSISKGSKEGKLLMENAEKEAFRQRIDRVKKEGEEASTKLLFPMIVLLGLTMALVMFPAVVRFRGI